MGTRIVVLGDSRVGKTEFAHRATGKPVPLNIYTSDQLEYFTLQGTCTQAQIVVVPGRADEQTLAQGCRGATGVVVLYTNDISSASRWLVRAAPRYTTPILLVSHRSTVPPGRAVLDTLQAWQTAEHACISSTVGMADCINRIVTRARRDTPSPL